MARLKKRKVWLTENQVQRMLDLAYKTNGEHDYLMLLLMRYGLRVGEILGDKGLPGIHAQDLRENGIWIRGKGYAAGIVQDRLVPMNSELMGRLRQLSTKRGRVFGVSVDTAQDRVKSYARLSGVEDWPRISPHRLRAFFATDAKDKGIDAFTIRDLMRHKNIQTTNLYVGESSQKHLEESLAKIG